VPRKRLKDLFSLQVSPQATQQRVAGNMWKTLNVITFRISTEIYVKGKVDQRTGLSLRLLLS